MAHLELSFLGPTQVVLDGSPLPSFPYDKVLALLAYLAIEHHHPHRRDLLAGLLWPEQPERAARHSLSQALWSLRRTLGDTESDTPIVLSTRDTVGMNGRADCWIDVQEVTSLIDACQAHPHPSGVICHRCSRWLTRAIELYRGPLLDGFASEVEIDEWVLVRREGFHRRITGAMIDLIAYHEARGESVEATSIASRLTSVDPLNEYGHRSLMRHLAISGQRSAALEHFERYRQLLMDELGIEPDAESRRLYHQIQDGTVHKPGPDAASSIPSHLPAQLSPFVGREDELAEIARILDEPSGRLITLTGPGGVGKTRIAIRAAEQHAHRYRHGAHFVPLASLESSELIPSTIGHVLGLSLQGRSSTESQLIAALRDRELLLVLDNAEHLVDGAPFVSALLENAPDVQIIVTSRERLNLSSEWIVDVDGLTIPVTEAQAARSGAVQMFMNSALRAGVRLDIPGPDAEPVLKLCRLTGGLPLGIELAAAWIPVLSPEEIAREIQTSLDFLSTTQRDLPARHRSIRAVFDHSWGLLSEHEQRAFMRLAVFRGGFRRAAAEHVAGANLPMLSSLVNTSLIRRTSSGRYEIHELLRQYGEERLDEHPEEAEVVRDRFASWFTSFLREQEQYLQGRDQRVALDAVHEERENIRLAWRWAIDHVRGNMIADAVYPFWLYAEVAGQYVDIDVILSNAIRALEPHADASTAEGRTAALAYGRSCVYWGSIRLRLDDDQRGDLAIDDGLAVLRHLGEHRDIGLGLNFKAVFAHLRGDVELERSYLLESLDHLAEAGDQWGTAYSLNDLGMAMFHLGDRERAREFQQRSVSLFTQVGDQRGLAYALHNLGTVAGDVGDSEEARLRLEEALAIRRAINHSWGIAVSLIALGRVATATGKMDVAESYLLEALREASNVQSIPATLSAMVGLSAIWVEHQEAQRAIEIADAVLRHPAADTTLREQARSVLLQVATEPLLPATTRKPAQELIDREVHRLLNSGRQDDIAHQGVHHASYRAN